MNNFHKYYNDEVILEIVLMNENLCFHRAAFPHPEGDWKRTRTMVESFAKPKWSFTPESRNGPLKVEVWCPVCERRYYEASGRIQKDIEITLGKEEQERENSEV